MKFLNLAETTVYVILTLLFLGAGIYGLYLILPTSFPSIAAQDVLTAGLFVALMVGVIVLGALAGSGGEGD